MTNKIDYLSVHCNKNEGLSFVVKNLNEQEFLTVYRLLRYAKHIVILQNKVITVVLEKDVRTMEHMLSHFGFNPIALESLKAKRYLLGVQYFPGKEILVERNYRQRAKVAQIYFNFNPTFERTKFFQTRQVLTEKYKTHAVVMGRNSVPMQFHWK